ncbi:MAG: hypothetical protein WA705_02280 [Candidatus Ozemobacteraceae bacterium]
MNKIFRFLFIHAEASDKIGLQPGSDFPIQPPKPFPWVSAEQLHDFIVVHVQFDSFT